MKFAMVAMMALALPLAARAEAVPGSPAPAFDVKDANGKNVKLADFAGKWVVLEWTNKDCPYVKKHYNSGNMQKLQETYRGKGVAWLTVLSSAKGKQGYLDPASALKQTKEVKSNATAFLLDENGAMGKAYGAKTTPHMYVIDPKGVVVYAGAIDDNDSSDPSVIAKSKNYVAMALDAGMSTPAKPVQTATSKPYGCAVKYQ
ncbi:MAG: thioredoxin family protein [Bdellovibrionaceae bacterium]|nr:thioredoxin family protein [Pseudobdellovibrionaceae bacterium]MBX3033802.1 thioredoxin family protein [Pseudobdellovibrionaceae bacterium]